MFVVIISLPNCLYNHLTGKAALPLWKLIHKPTVEMFKFYPLASEIDSMEAIWERVTIFNTHEYMLALFS